MKRGEMRTLCGYLFGLTIGLALCITPAGAQRVSLSPTIGVYIPTSELIKAANGQEFKQEIALAVGGRLGVNFSRRLGVVASVTYVPSSLRFTFNQNETKTDANLLFGTARATVYVIPTTSPVWLNLNAGASLVKRGGAAYDSLADKQDGYRRGRGNGGGIQPRRLPELLRRGGRLHLRDHIRGIRHARGEAHSERYPVGSRLRGAVAAMTHGQRHRSGRLNPPRRSSRVTRGSQAPGFELTPALALKSPLSL